MTNPIALRFVLVAVILAGTTVGILAFAFMKFPDSAIVIALAVIVTTVSVFFVQKKERALRFEAYYQAVRDLGTSISFGKYDAAFERNGTRFELEFPRNEHQPAYVITFFLPGISEKFSICSRTLLTVKQPDCVEIQDSSLPHEYLVQARNREFLLELLKQYTILNNIRDYSASFWGGFSITFSDGSFELIWAPPLDQQLTGVSTICYTAVLFHDELSKFVRK